MQAGLPPNPVFAFSAGFPQGAPGLPDLTYSASQSLVDLLLIPIRKKTAESELEQTRLAVAQEAVEVAGEGKRTCYLLLGLQKAEAITRENLALAERSTALAQRRFEAGEGDHLDVNLARSDALDIKRQLLALQRDRQIAEVDLARVLGLARSQVIWNLVGDLPPPEKQTSEADGGEGLSRRRRERLRDAAVPVRARFGRPLGPLATLGSPSHADQTPAHHLAPSAKTLTTQMAQKQIFLTHRPSWFISTSDYPPSAQGGSWCKTRSSP